jgi:hypothetical protein
MYVDVQYVRRRTKIVRRRTKLYVDVQFYRPLSVSQSEDALHLLL